MPHAPWPARLTRAIADQIRRHRGQRGMSAQQLADRCAQLGFEIPRATLADLENGRRATLSVAELLIIARALEISPLLLIAPAGVSDAVEISPGQRLRPWDAARWLAGLAELHEGPGGLEVAAADEDDVIPMFIQHDELVTDIQLMVPTKGLADPEGKIVGRSTELLRPLMRVLRSHRSRMRKAGLMPPELPPNLAQLDRQPAQAQDAPSEDDYEGAEPGPIEGLFGRPDLPESLPRGEALRLPDPAEGRREDGK